MLSIGLTTHLKKPLALNISHFACKPNPQLTLTRNNNYIKVTNSIKYLQVLIDEQLSFNYHIDSL